MKLTEADQERLQRLVKNHAFQTGPERLLH
jgi:hypothetical protein